MATALERLKAYAGQQAEQGVRQTKLARRLRVSQATLSRILAGKRPVTVDFTAAVEEATEGWGGGQILMGEWRGYKPDASSSEPVSDATESEPAA